jgi:hypothetical protein
MSAAQISAIAPAIREAVDAPDFCATFEVAGRNATTPAALPYRMIPVTRMARPEALIARPMTFWSFMSLWCRRARLRRFGNRDVRY